MEGQPPESSVQHLFDALDQSKRGEPVYSAFDEEQVAAIKARKAEQVSKEERAQAISEIEDYLAQHLEGYEPLTEQEKLRAYDLYQQGMEPDDILERIAIESEPEAAHPEAAKEIERSPFDATDLDTAQAVGEGLPPRRGGGEAVAAGETRAARGGEAPRGVVKTGQAVGAAEPETGQITTETTPAGTFRLTLSVVALLFKQAEMLPKKGQRPHLVVHFDPDPPNLPGVFTPANLEIGDRELRNDGSLLRRQVGEVGIRVAIVPNPHQVVDIGEGDLGELGDDLVGLGLGPLRPLPHQHLNCFRNVRFFQEGMTLLIGSLGTIAGSDCGAGGVQIHQILFDEAPLLWRQGIRLLLHDQSPAVKLLLALPVLAKPYMPTCALSALNSSSLGISIARCRTRMASLLRLDLLPVRRLQPGSQLYWKALLLRGARQGGHLSKRATYLIGPLRGSMAPFGQ